jgi:oligo-1,6-glucosidase
MIRKKTKEAPAALSKALDGMQLVGWDNARVPMQWDSSPNAGFCGGDAKPGMRVIDIYKEINVADQLGRKDSILEFWKRLWL